MILLPWKCGQYHASFDVSLNAAVDGIVNAVIWVIEQGASASQPGRIMLFIIREQFSTCPGMAGEANDAVSAYTQVCEGRTQTAKAFGNGLLCSVDTLVIVIQLSGTKINDPLVLVDRNVFGHPLAGSLWERKLEEILIQEHWKHVKR